MGDGELSYRQIGASSSEALLELVRLGLGESAVPRSGDFWNWKHVHNPFGESYCLAAEADGQLVGLRAFLRWSFRAAERTVPAVRAVDTVTHPDWRGRGVFSKLTRSLLEVVERDGVHFVFNTPNDRSRPGYLKMGWQVVGRVPVLLKPLRPLRLVRGLLSRRSDPQPVEPSPLDLPPVAELLSTSDVEELLHQGEESDLRLHTIRSRRYLRWRYQDIPGLRYHALWERAEDRVAAVVLRARIRGPFREVSVAEVLLGDRPGCWQLASRLLRRAAERTGADYLVASAPFDTPEARALRWARFLPLARIGPQFTIRPLGDRPPPVSWPSWRLSLGDVEIF